MKTVWLGLSITSSWGNGHATNYRGLLAALAQRGHEVLFLERDVPWYAATRDFSAPFVRLYRSLDELLLTPARARPESRFALAGPQYPEGIDWPANVERLDSLPPAEHAAFYASQRFTLNVTRADMVAAGWSPSARLFEAAACGVPVISDWWDGLDAFFEPGHEILVAGDADDVLRHLRHGDRAVGHRARERVLAAHTADHRAAELEDHVARVREGVPV